MHIMCTFVRVAVDERRDCHAETTTETTTVSAGALGAIRIPGRSHDRLWHIGR